MSVDHPPTRAAAVTEAAGEILIAWQERVAFAGLRFEVQGDRREADGIEAGGEADTHDDPSQSIVLLARRTRTIVAAMIATPHMLVGAACASRTHSVKGALAIGVLTHLALDAVPHRDYRLDALGGLVLAADLAAGTLAAVRLSGGSQVVLAGAVGGVLPDVVALAERASGKSPIGCAHVTAHTESRPSPWLSTAIQGLTAVMAAMALRATTSRSPH